jgi:hypothetical protein
MNWHIGNLLLYCQSNPVGAKSFYTFRLVQLKLRCVPFVDRNFHGPDSGFSVPLAKNKVVTRIATDRACLPLYPTLQRADEKNENNTNTRLFTPPCFRPCRSTVRDTKFRASVFCHFKKSNLLVELDE